MPFGLRIVIAKRRFTFFFAGFKSSYRFNINHSNCIFVWNFFYDFVVNFCCCHHTKKKDWSISIIWCKPNMWFNIFSYAIRFLRLGHFSFCHISLSILPQTTYAHALHKSQNRKYPIDILLPRLCIIGVRLRFFLHFILNDYQTVSFYHFHLKCVIFDCSIIEMHEFIFVLWRQLIRELIALNCVDGIENIRVWKMPHSWCVKSVSGARWMKRGSYHLICCSQAAGLRFHNSFFNYFFFCFCLLCSVFHL